MRTNISRIERALKERVRGEVRFDYTTRVLYSTDASNYQIVPLGVVIPVDADDVHAVVDLAAAESIAITPRCAGTSVAGQAIGASIILDFSKYMNRILKIDPDRRMAIVEPGVRLAQLNEAAKPYSLVFGADPATGNRCNLGGMIGTNACGAHSVVYGKTADHVTSLTCVLPDGSVVELGANRMNVLSRTLRDLVQNNRELILSRYPDIPRCVSGYNLRELVSLDEFNPARIIVGSEGTLGMVTEARLNLCPLPQRDGAMLLSFPDRFTPLDAVPGITELGPRALEMVDDRLLNAARSAPAFAAKVAVVPSDAAGILVVEFGGESDEEVRDALDRLAAECSSLPGKPQCRVMTIKDRQGISESVRKAGVGLLGRTVGDAKPTAFVEDTGVSPLKLGKYARRFEKLALRHNSEIAIYGHAGQGVLHMRPTVDLTTAEGVAKMRAIAEEVADLVVEFGGSLSGEHGDGLARSEFLPKMFGTEIMDLHQQIKNLFDPAGLMNPGKIIDPLPMDQNLRYGPGYTAMEPKTYFDFSDDAGYHRAVQLCNGMGECRKMDSGTMCPSYMVTMDEMHSTRARANAIRAALSGTFMGVGDRSVLEVLDLCLECKACKSECPISVDVAKYKPEFLAQYYRLNGTPFSARAFGMIHTLASAGTVVPWLWNWVNKGPLSNYVKQITNVHPNRSMPTLASENFRKWFRRRGGSRNPNGRPVLLFDDTFNTYFEPAPLKAAVQILENIGCKVVLTPKPVCCGRAFISKGMLKEARRLQENLVRVLAPMVEQGLTIVGLEPGCLLTLRDELPYLARDSRARLIAENSVLLEEYLANNIDYRPGSLEAKAIVHGHCHQKALSDMNVVARLLDKIEGLDYSILDSGCCGMAGSFGYETEHYEISRAIGERVLFRAVRAAGPEDFIVADGFSCRSQISDFCDGRRTVHMAELLVKADVCIAK